MNENEYLENRLQDQIDWYDRKSQISQRWFKRLRVFEFIAAAGIPFMAGYSGEFEYLTPVVGFLGVLVAVVAGLLSLNQFQERWVEYRTTGEALKREKYLFLAKVYPYDGERSFPMLVQNIESLIAKETSAWGQYMRVAGKQQEETPSGTPEPAPEQPLPSPETNAGGSVVEEGTGPSKSVVEQVEDTISITKNVAQVLPKEVGGALQEISTRAEEGLAIFKEATEAEVVQAAVTAAQEILGASPQPKALFFPQHFQRRWQTGSF